mmetsp:Transcript_108211/g.186838  ORF Transcript_108211/g.186838 Transcript_108211/m.186838 type:complete len:326 (+) Transcript_108211:834-1811(+)
MANQCPACPGPRANAWEFGPSDLGLSKRLGLALGGRELLIEVLQHRLSVLGVLRTPHGQEDAAAASGQCRAREAPGLCAGACAGRHNRHVDGQLLVWLGTSLEEVKQGPLLQRQVQYPRLLECIHRQLVGEEMVRVELLLRSSDVLLRPNTDGAAAPRTASGVLLGQCQHLDRRDGADGVPGDEERVIGGDERREGHALHRPPAGDEAEQLPRRLREEGGDGFDEERVELPQDPPPHALGVDARASSQGSAEGDHAPLKLLHVQWALVKVDALGRRRGHHPHVQLLELLLRAVNHDGCPRVLGHCTQVREGEGRGGLVWGEGGGG